MFSMITVAIYTSYATSAVFLYFVQDSATFNSFSISVFVSLSVQVYPAVFLVYFIPAAVILHLAYLALMV